MNAIVENSGRTRCGLEMGLNGVVDLGQLTIPAAASIVDLSEKLMISTYKIDPYKETFYLGIHLSPT